MKTSDHDFSEEVNTFLVYTSWFMAGSHCFSIDKVLHEQLLQHQVHVQGKFTKFHVQQIQHKIRGLSFHCEDHKATNLRVFCEYTYAKMLSSTGYHSASMFQPLMGSPSQYEAEIQSRRCSSFKRIGVNMYHTNTCSADTKSIHTSQDQEALFNLKASDPFP